MPDPHMLQDGPRPEATRAEAGQRPWRLRHVAGLALALASVSACTARESSPGTSGGDPQPASSVAAQGRQQLLVELFSWWTAPGEAEALQSLVDAHKATYPDARLFNAAAASGTQAKAVLYERLEAGDPPDLYQENIHDLRLYIGKNRGKYASIDGLVDELGLRDVIYPEVLADITMDGQIYALPVNLHRENTLVYNKKLFETHGISPPTTVEELLGACEKLSGAGVVPIATAYQGWILRIMFNSLAMASMGIERYRDFMIGRVPPDDPAFLAAIDLFAEILTKYVNPDAAEEGFNWTNAAQAIFNGDAAMFLHGDWATGYLLQLGWRPGVDFGTAVAPGAAGMFLYGVDVFALPMGAKNERGAREFLTTIASPAAQAAFNRVKGSSPIRRDAPVDQLEVLGRATMADLAAAKIRLLVRTRPAWDTAIERFARDRDKAALVKVYMTDRPGR